MSTTPIVSNNAMLDTTQPILLITDLEPDDAFAFAVLTAARVKIAHVLVVNRGNEDHWSRDKLTNELLTTCKQFVTYTYCSAAEMGLTLASTLTTMQCKRIVCLANFLPLVDLILTQPELAKQIKVWAYGSANLRWALDLADPNIVMNAINTGYKAFYLFETHGAFGLKNVASVTTTPEFAQWLRTTQTPIAEFLRKIIKEWNNITLLKYFVRFANASDEPNLKSFCANMTFDQFATMVYGNDDSNKEIRQQFAGILRQIPSTSTHHRAVKIVLQLLDDAYELVFADIGLIVAALHPEWSKHFVPCDLSIDDKRYVCVTHNENSTAHYFISPQEEQKTALNMFASHAIQLLH
jgi:hypothetical protein